MTYVYIYIFLNNYHPTQLTSIHANSGAPCAASQHRAPAVATAAWRGGAAGASAATAPHGLGL